MTRVQFFKDKEGNRVFAFFPDIRDNIFNKQIRLSYSHVGQHSPCSIAYVFECEVATPDEYLDLRLELINVVGYNDLFILAGFPVEYHRNPTKFELKMGYGAIHYKSFHHFLCQKDTGEFKTWLKCPIDGLRYYRSTH